MKRAIIIVLLAAAGACLYAGPNQDLLRAAGKGDVAALQKAIVNGGNVLFADDLGRTALHMAAAAGSVDALKLLLSKGAKIDAADTSGWTALVTAADNFSSAAMSYLLQKGAAKPPLAAYVRAMDPNGVGPLHMAAGRLDAPCVSLFLSAFLPLPGFSKASTFARVGATA